MEVLLPHALGIAVTLKSLNEVKKIKNNDTTLSSFFSPLCLIGRQSQIKYI